MHAELTELELETGKWLIEVIDQDPETAIDMVVARYTLEPDSYASIIGVYASATWKLINNGFYIGSTHGTFQQINECGHRASEVARIKSPAAAQASEADAMLAASQTLALYALKAVDKAKAEASVGNRDHTKNHAYMKARAALDAHCEQLAQLMWIRKVQEAKAEGKEVLGAPSAAEAEKYLRDFVGWEG